MVYMLASGDTTLNTHMQSLESRLRRLLLYPSAYLVRLGTQPKPLKSPLSDTQL